ncbi:adenine deaminase [Actinobaculum suis]|uniref:adenosine deaminase n=1 Tax=Actinobaculum suis TaxID=1657 RepID=UPI00066FC8B4|nr:adenosine deaminase [Actinobaculum suis]KMY23678.1 adenine deaminase [Actinobaculum suis]
MEISPFVRDLPKVELHLHIEGTLEPDLKFKLAERNRVEIPYKTEQEVKDSYQFTDLASFLDAYYEGMRVLLTPQDFYDLAMAYFERVAAQNVRYVEMFFDPQAHTARGVPFHTVISGLHRAQLEADRRFGIKSGLIMCFLRDFQAEFAMATLLEALPYRDWIIGVGLDSDETGNPPEKFAEVFARARAEGFLLTMHCDVDIKNSVNHIRQVIETIGVDRIDHGTNIVEAPELVAEVKKRGIGLTSCPISNTWVSDSSKVELIKQLVADGVEISVHSDDPAYFGGYIAENYQRVADEGELDNAFLANLARNAVRSSWATPMLKQEILAEIDATEKRYQQEA